MSFLPSLAIKPSSAKQAPSPVIRSLRKSKSNRGFTLVEMLIVIVVISILIALTVPYIIGSIGASRLTSAGDQLTGLFSSAQQIASSEGRTVEVRLYRHTSQEDMGGAPRYRTAVLFRFYEQGEPNPDPTPAMAGQPLPQSIALLAAEPLLLPSSIVISENTTASTLLSLPASNQPAKKSYIIRAGLMEEYVFHVPGADFVSFLFRPENTNLDPSRKWFASLVESTQEERNVSPGEWKNFFCVQVDPVNGRITSYRP